MARRRPRGHADSLRLVRHWRFSGEVVAYLFSPACTPADREAFDQRVRALDGDPITHSDVVLRPGDARFRRFVFGSHVAVMQFDPSAPPHGEVRVIACEPIIPSAPGGAA